MGQYETYKPSTRFSVSQLTSCRRRQVYSAIGLPKKFRGAAESLVIMEAGSYYHDMLQSQFMRDGLLHPLYNQSNGRPDEIKIVNQELQLTGKVDGITPDLRTLVEFKTTNAESFEYTVLNQQGPSANHVAQLNTYLGLLKDEVPAPTKGLVIYWNKNQQVTRPKQKYFKEKGLSQLMVEYPITFDPTMYDNTLARVAEMSAIVDKHLLSGNADLPPKEGSAWECKSCAFHYTCKGKDK